ncbi:MAG TPA: RpiB/LacA/LacB family sugar-phosphate isomerase [Nitrospira sp.]|nr:RpiB/LacA/LacB family sugar-phosphate isomerase [Nitrospira sp.]
MLIGIAADHAGFTVKEQLEKDLRAAGYEVVDYGAHAFNPEDDYPDFVAPLARAVASGEVERGIAICGSSIGACIAANKVAGVRAGPCTDNYSAHQGVEHDDMNIICIGGRVIGYALAWELIRTFLAAHFIAEERFTRRLRKIVALEKEGDS